MSLPLCPNAARHLLRAATPRGPMIPGAVVSRIASRWPSPSKTNTFPTPPGTRLLSYACYTNPRPNIYSKSSMCRAGGAQCRTFFSGGVIRDYIDLPRDYKDRTGLPFRKKDLSAEEVARIFGKGIQPASANHLLRILHGRRVAGTLDDPAYTVNTAQYPEEQISKALSYLRDTVKVDEVLNAGLRAEDELAQLEEAEKERAEATEQKGNEEEEEEEADETNKVDPVYGRSSFDEIRARNQAKEKAREKAREEERAAAEAAGQEAAGADANKVRSLVEVDEGQRAITNPKIAEYYLQASSDIKEAPQMSLARRVGPSALLFVAVIGVMAALTAVYEEPAERYRLMPQISTGMATMGALMAVNVGVYVLWRIPPMWKLMNRYMILVVGKPRPLTVLTANFSHQTLAHLTLNMALLALGGLPMHEDLGRMGFLTLFMFCGAGGFLGGLAVYAARGRLGVSTLGASGAAVGVLGAYYWDHRDDRFRIFGLPDEGVHGIVWWALLVGYHVYEGMRGIAARSGKDVVGHWVGLLLGMVGVEVMKWAGLGRKGREASESVKVEVERRA